MGITQNEINAASIAINAFIFYLGQKKISEQMDKSALINKKASDRNAKRDAYAGLIAAIEELLESNEAGDSKRTMEAEKSINSCLALIDVIAPKKVYLPASDVMEFAGLPRDDDSRDQYLNRLYTAMREDLEVDNPEYELRPAVTR